MRESFVDKTITLPFPRTLYPMGNQWIIEWNCAKEGNPINEPFLNHIQRGQQSKEKLFSVYNKEEVLNSRIKPALFIFHVSRCGSTLAANYLATDRENRVYNEPRVLAKLFADLGNGDIDVGKDFAKYINTLQLGALPYQKRLIVKLSCRYIRYLPLFERFYPDVPKWLVVRNPTEVLASNVMNPPHYISGKLEEGYSTDECASVVVESWRQVYHDALKYRELFSHVVDYSRLKISLKDLEKSLWPVTDQPERKVLVAAVLSKSSKRGNKVFKEDLKKKLAYRNLFETISSNYFHQMERDYARIISEK